MSTTNPAPTTFAIYLKRRATPVLIEACDIFAACSEAERRFGRRVDLVNQVRA